MSPCTPFVSLQIGLLSSLLVAAPSCAETTPGCNPLCGTQNADSINCLYCATPDTVTAEMGMFATGAAVGDIDRDGFVDLVFASGNDMAPQPLTVYYGSDDEPVPFYPQWTAGTIGYGIDVALGDVNNDGWLDAAVAVGIGIDRSIAHGRVEVYLNIDGVFELQPSYRTAGGFGATGVAWGDIDADADLDLIVAVAFESQERFPPENLTQIVTGRARIYENTDGGLSPTPAWISRDNLLFADVRVADINQDGWMDVAFSAYRTAVYYGRPPRRDGGIPLPTRADWQSSDTHAFSFGIDAGYRGQLPRPDQQTEETPTGQPLMVAVSSSRYQDPILPEDDPRPRFLNLALPDLVEDDNSTARAFLAYEPTESGSSGPFYTSTTTTYASKLALRDLDQDGQLDLIGSQWGDINAAPPLEGAPLWIFAGQGDTFTVEPTYQSENRSVGESIQTADFQNNGLETTTYSYKAVARSAVVTLPQLPRSIREVRLEGHLVNPVDYAWTPAGGWIALAKPLEVGQQLIVVVERSPVQDIALATWNPELGNLVYNSFFSTTGASTGDSP